MPPACNPVVVIGIDAAEGSLMRRLVDEGRLPAIARLAGASGWGTVTSPAPIGSGAVWPTFTTGDSPDVHGLFGEYAWDPASLTLVRRGHTHLSPFWRDLAADGITAAVVDVPFAPIVAHERLIEIADWGAHDWCGDGLRVHPPAIESALADVLAVPHPLAAGPVDSEGPGDVDGLRDVARACRSGAQRRGDLTVRLLETVPLDLLLVVFPELHRASHLLWHTVDSAHPAWTEGLGPLPDDVMGGLVDVAVAIDQQVERLIAHGGRARAALVFSLHGMQPARGIPAFLNDVLEQWGFAVRRPWWERPLRRHVGDLVRAGKRRVPQSIKSAYYRRASRSLTRRLSQPPVPVPDWDWPRTRAFSIPSDQHGWIRLNLAGREARGIVRASEYLTTCAELREHLLGLSSTEGPLVRDVTMTEAVAGGPPKWLPDLVIHWTPLTRRPHLRLVDPPLDATPIGPKFVSQHADDGFFVGSGLARDDWPSTVDASELGRRIGTLLRRR